MLINSENLQFSYDKSTVFTYPDISCGPAKVLLIMGGSGVGKTTLLHLLAGLLSPTSGSVWILGKDICKMKGSELDRFRAKNIGLVFQSHHFIDSLNVLENVLLAAYLAGEKQDVGKAIHYLDKLGIADKANAKLYRLSQGQRQRVAIARALMNEPKVILADEPSSGLDDKNTYQMAELLESQAVDIGAALLIVTHDRRLTERFQDLVLIQ